MRGCFAAREVSAGDRSELHTVCAPNVKGIMQRVLGYVMICGEDGFGGVMCHNFFCCLGKLTRVNSPDLDWVEDC